MLRQFNTHVQKYLDSYITLHTHTHTHAKLIQNGLESQM